MQPHSIIVALVCGLVVTPLAAQRTVPFARGAPVAPTALSIPPLPTTPLEYATAEGQNIRVIVLARDLNHPWSIAFLPDGAILVSERSAGHLRVIRNDRLEPQPVAGLPEILVEGISGLLDIALHPRFADNQYIYFSYLKPLPEKKHALAVTRGRWDGTALRDTHDVFVAGPGTGAISRIAFGRDGMLYMSSYGGDPQNPNDHGGKILRLTDEGRVPPDNPFVGRPDHKPEIYTLGHRSPLGLAMHPITGEMWELEMGPNGGDEINILRSGANYGWPLVSLGRTYPGPWQSERFQRDGFVDPVVYWMPSISVSGLAFYTGDKLAKWKGDVFVGGMRTGEVPGTGHLERILFNEKMEELRRESLLTDLRRRIRDVRQGPDDLLYLVTDEDDGGVLRIEPAD